MVLPPRVHVVVPHVLLLLLLLLLLLFCVRVVCARGGKECEWARDMRLSETVHHIACSFRGGGGS